MGALLSWEAGLTSKLTCTRNWNILLTNSSDDERNKKGGPDYYSEEKWKTLFTTTQALADGSYSPPDSDPKGRAGMRRYGAAKLCEVMMM